MREDPLFWATFQELWHRGRAHEYVLDSGQQAWCSRREAADGFSVWMIARQRGKSFAALFDDIMFAERTPGAICRYLGQTGDSAHAILGPTLDQIMALCPLPKSERPWPYSKNDSLGGSSELRWANGATYVWSGTDNDTFRRQRGPRSHRITFDEAGFYAKLSEVEDALLPSLQTTGGSPLYLSTPSVSPGHPFVERYEAAAAVGRSELETIYENPRLTPADVEKIIERESALHGQSREKFLKSTYWRREYLAEVVLDTELAVVPEFPEVRDAIVIERERPAFYDLDIACDPGTDDFTGVLFAVTDFRRGKLIVEHELMFKKGNTATISAGIFEVLQRHYGAILAMEGSLLRLQSNSPKPHSFVIDDDKNVICSDLWNYHRISAQPARKDDSEAAINVMRVEIGARNIEINPRCVHLIRQLGTAVRVKPGGDMARSRLDGHYDLVATLKYLIRHWDKRRNPFPNDYGFDTKTQARSDRPKPVSLGAALLAGTSLGRRR